MINQSILKQSYKNQIIHKTFAISHYAWVKQGAWNIKRKKCHCCWRKKKKHKHYVGKNVNVVGGSFITHKGISPMVLTEPFGDGKSHQQEWRNKRDKGQMFENRPPVNCL